MQNINRVALTGNLTRDPETKEYGDTKVCTLRIAVNGRIRRQGEWVDKANFFDVVTFGRTADNCAQYLTRGRPIALDGRLDWQEWEVDGGGKRQRVQIIADNVQFLDGGNRDEGERSEGSGDFAPVSSAPVVTTIDDDIPF